MTTPCSPFVVCSAFVMDRTKCFNVTYKTAYASKQKLSLGLIKSLLRRKSNILTELFSIQLKKYIMSSVYIGYRESCLYQKSKDGVSGAATNTGT